MNIEKERIDTNTLNKKLHNFTGKRERERERERDI